MVCLTFHTAIIINRKNWRITIKLHFENLSILFSKSERTHMLRPLPLFLFVHFSMTPPLPYSTNALFEWPLMLLNNFAWCCFITTNFILTEFLWQFLTLQGIWRHNSKGVIDRTDHWEYSPACHQLFCVVNLELEGVFLYVPIDSPYHLHW